MKAFQQFSSHLLPLKINDIDTDQIIPTRYLKVVSKSGLADGLFADWRHNPDGSLNNDFALNLPGYRHAKILLAGDNFGCGSSREHAPWALVDWGFQAVISTSFADIFRNNALKNSLLPIVVEKQISNLLFDIVEMDPKIKISIDLSMQVLTLPNGTEVRFPIDRFSKQCLLEGIDQLGYLLTFEDQISAFEQNNTWVN